MSAATCMLSCTLTHLLLTAPRLYILIPPTPSHNSTPDLLLILWPIFFVAVAEEQPNLKPRNFTKSVVRGAERAAVITKVVAVLDPLRRTTPVDAGNTKTASSMEDGLEPEKRSPWEPPAFERQVRACLSLARCCWTLASSVGLRHVARVLLAKSVLTAAMILVFRSVFEVFSASLVRQILEPPRSLNLSPFLCHPLAVFPSSHVECRAHVPSFLPPSWLTRTGRVLWMLYKKSPTTPNNSRYQGSVLAGNSSRVLQRGD